MVLDVEDANPLPGTWVSLWDKNSTDAQQWYDDPYAGTIRCKLNGLCLDIESKILNWEVYLQEAYYLQCS